jgi:S-layer homology domain
MPLTCTSENTYFRDSARAGNLCGYIETLRKEGVVSSSYQDFRPSDLVTRAEMVKMLIRGQKIQERRLAGDTSPFSFENTIERSSYTDIEKNRIFRPNDPSSRGEAFKIASCTTDQVYSSA